MTPHDIFISYAHSDDDVPAECTTGWVTTFVDELRKIMHRRIGGKGADIWTDHKLASNERVSNTLREKVRSSRCLVLFLSNGYLASDWCQHELGEFLRVNADHKNRDSVFIVELDRVDRARWPKGLRELTPIPLYEVDVRSQIPLLLGFPRPPPDSRSPYWSRLNTLAHLISEHLTESQFSVYTKQDISNEHEGCFVEPPSRTVIRDAEVQTKRTVWIAAPPEELSEAWESLAAGLRQQGANVLPLGRSSYIVNNAQSFRAAVEEDLNNSALLVQLLGEQPGAMVANSTENACEMQALLARLSLMHRPGTPFRQWRSPLVDLIKLPESSHRRLLQGTISCGFESFRQSVLEEYQRFNALSSSHAPTATEVGRPLQVCVTAGPSDETNCVQVCEVLKSLGHNALPANPAPYLGQSPSDYRSQFEELLALVDGVILVRGSTAPMWLQSRYVQLSKLSGGRRPWGALLDAPGAGQDMLLYGRVEFERLDCREGIRPPPIEKFVLNLQQESTGAQA